MKLLSFGPRDAERAGILVNGMIIDLNTAFPHIPPSLKDILAGGLLGEIAGLDFGGAERIAPGQVRLGPPVTRPDKIICLGRNYLEHIKEGEDEKTVRDVPKAPLLFCKTVNALAGPHDDVIHPAVIEQVDYEVELAAVIGTRCRNVPEEDALDCVAGYTVLHDVSGRDAQFGDGQWFRGKSFDTFCPTGPYLVTRDEVPDAHNLRLTTNVNGELRQDGNTRDMIFKIPYIVSYISQCMTLEAGDLIGTGTPSGVGVFMNPPRLLNVGDVVELDVERIGTITNRIAAAP